MFAAAKDKNGLFNKYNNIVWTDLAPLQPTFWNGVIGYQELTREEITKWCWKLRAMLDNETILIWQLREYLHQYPFDYREVLEELLDSFEKILIEEKFKNSRFIIEFLSEKAERKSSIDWWEYY